MTNGESTIIGYRPEVRSSYSRPVMASGQIVDAVWRPIEYTRNQTLIGIPQGYFDAKLTEHGLLGLAQAEAIRWWFIASAEAEGPTGSMCLETRLQKYKLTITHKVEELDVRSALDCRGRPLNEGEPGP